MIAQTETEIAATPAKYHDAPDQERKRERETERARKEKEIERDEFGVR